MFYETSKTNSETTNSFDTKKKASQDIESEIIYYSKKVLVQEKITDIHESQVPTHSNII